MTARSGAVIFAATPKALTEFNACEAVDPEGNVIQFREETA